MTPDKYSLVYRHDDGNAMGWEVTVAAVPSSLREHGNSADQLAITLTAKGSQVSTEPNGMCDGSVTIYVCGSCESGSLPNALRQAAALVELILKQ